MHKAVSVADVGKAINPRLVEAQEMGGAMQGIGNALHEEMVFDRTGTLLNATLFEYHVPTIADMPDTFVSNIVENADGPGPYGAKGVGEGSLAGVAAAIATALADAGVRIDTIPATPERVWCALAATRGGDGERRRYRSDEGLSARQRHADARPVVRHLESRPGDRVPLPGLRVLCRSSRRQGHDRHRLRQSLGGTEAPVRKAAQSEDQTIAAQLAKIGVQPEEIDIVINSHLHFDHCSNNKLFPQAKFYFSKSELRHSYVPDPWERLGYDPDLVVMPGMKTELLDLGHYEYEVLPGITLIETPGHSAGHLSVILQPGGDAQPMVFPGRRGLH